MTDKHFSSQFENELQVVSAQLIELGNQVNAQVSRTIEALTHFDAEGARQVLAAEAQVNRLEADIDHEITTIIARRQPAARDLRLLMAISKASGSLERVGNGADKMAHKVLKLVRTTSNRILPPPELRTVTELATGLLRTALDAFAQLSLSKAMTVMKEEDQAYKEVDALVHKLVDGMIATPHMISYYVELIALTKSLELILDHAKHIAELVVYVAQGADVRHTPVEQIESLIR
jgi:phosphate transport system protein